VQFNGVQAIPNGVLSQTFLTTAGTIYNLNFDLGVVAWRSNAPETARVTAVGSGTLLSQDVSVRGKGGTGTTTAFTPEAFTFTANSSSTTLSFKDISSATQNIDLLLDNVRVTSGAAPTPTPTPTPPGRKSLANVSTRNFVQSGDAVMIGGFIITGDSPKKVLLRAVGPSLTKAGLRGAMLDPVLDLYDSTSEVVASNDNWGSDRQNVLATGAAPTDEHEAAIVATLPAGAYTAVVHSVNNISGVALFELYDLDPASSWISNISTRGKVETGDSVMIGGFIIGGDQPTTVIIRAIGPSLARSGIADALSDPTLELHNASGSLIYANDNWRTTQEAQILASTIPPSNDKESAIVATLNPGSYTAIVRGASNSTGVALVEVYNLDK
jgi:hypothetical protein